MISFATLSVFLLAALGLLVIPGPAVMYIATRAVTHGRKAGLASVAGIEAASLCHSVAAALGISAILYASSLAFSVVKYLGAAYLIYLGIRTLLSKQPVLLGAGGGSPRLRDHFRRGLLVNLLNPKTALFFYAFLPQFVDPARGSSVLQVLVLGALFVALATITDTAYALISSGVGAALLHWKPFLRLRRYVSGGIYICLGVGTAVSGSGRNAIP